TLSRRIKNYEIANGLKLFDRLKEGMRITEEGLKIVDTAQKMEQLVNEMDLNQYAVNNDMSGPLKVAIPQLIIKYALMDIIEDFIKTYPQIQLSVIVTNDFVSFSRRQADIAIRATNEPEKGLWGRKILDQKRGYFGASKLANAPEKLVQLPLLNFNWHGFSTPEAIKSVFPNAKTTLLFDDMIAALFAAEAGLGILRMPCFIGNGNNLLKPITKLACEYYSEIWALTHPDLKKNVKVKTFMSFTTQRLQQKKALFSDYIFN
ncbi:MAG: LysR family transcriptional regulator, partial [Alphaproteobacteria bacterium]|nr:LysR family transcriptional regulator [Alphaproteobacteria bacterium]